MYFGRRYEFVVSKKLTLYSNIYTESKLTDCTDLGITPKVNGNESDPNHASGVHGEPNKLGFIEVLRDVTSFEGVERAESDEEEVEGERHDDTLRRGVADEDGAVEAGVVEGRTRRLQHQHGSSDPGLQTDQYQSHQHLPEKTIIHCTG